MTANKPGTGDPNGEVPNLPASQSKTTQQQDTIDQPNLPYWDAYDTINQFYMEIGSNPERKNHYRGHKMSLWLNLIPQLHRPGDADEVSMNHHHFQEKDDIYYDGVVRPQLKERPPFFNFPFQPSDSIASRTTMGTSLSTPLPPKSDTALQATTTTECPPNTTILLQSKTSNNLLRKLASSHYQSYTTALTVTITVGCFLLLLNILIFVGIYHQRDKGRNKRKLKQKEQERELVEAGSCSSSSGDPCFDKEQERQQFQQECKKSPYHMIKSCNSDNRRLSSQGCNFGTYSTQESSCEMTELTELPLQNFNSSPVKRTEGTYHAFPPDVTATGNSQNMACKSEQTSPAIPEPPPPPKNQPPSGGFNQGILRNSGYGTHFHGSPSTPSTTKKRVQIQEISV